MWLLYELIFELGGDVTPGFLAASFSFDHYLSADAGVAGPTRTHVVSRVGWLRSARSFTYSSRPRPCRVACQSQGAYVSFRLAGRTECKACRSCHRNASVSGECAKQADNISCTCNAGLYGNGTRCLPCKVCPAHAATSFECAAGSPNDTVTCTCNAGYYGDGSACSECRACDRSATQLSMCGAGSLYDNVTCACNAEFYGDGFSCTRCKECSSFATKSGGCPFGGTSDGIGCCCNAGYYGNGTYCEACPADTYQDSTCESVLYCADDG